MAEGGSSARSAALENSLCLSFSQQHLRKRTLNSCRGGYWSGCGDAGTGGLREKIPFDVSIFRKRGFPGNKKKRAINFCEYHVEDLPP